MINRRAYSSLTELIKVRYLATVPRKNGDAPPEVITIKEAARLLGVSEPTLRRWDDLGKFTARRHPVNGYRLYVRSKVLAMRKKIFGNAA
jgi:excisionase family DNA binding protein